MTISKTAQQLLDSSTCCYLVFLAKNNQQYFGIYNGLSYWGRIEDEDGNLVEILTAEFDSEEQQPYNFRELDFVDNGYEITQQ